MRPAELPDVLQRRLRLHVVGGSTDVAAFPADRLDPVFHLGRHVLRGPAGHGALAADAAPEGDPVAVADLQLSGVVRLRVDRLEDVDAGLREALDGEANVAA